MERDVSSEEKNREKVNKQIVEILGRVIVIETKIDSYNDVRNKVECAYNQSLQNKEDIQEMEEANKWLWRLVLATILISFINKFLVWNVV